MGLFDGYRRAAKDVVVNTMGVVARWIPSDGYIQHEVKVLFRYPTQQEGISGHDYRAIRPRIEYLESELPGLFEKVQAKQQEEITIDGKIYLAFEGELKFGGKEIIVYLELKEK